MPPFDSAPAKQASLRKIVPIFLGSLLFVFLVWALVPPPGFPRNTIVLIPEGSGLSGIAHELEKVGAINSTLKFRLLTYLMGGERRMKAGEYALGKPEGALFLAWRIREGKHDIESKKITVPEGFTVEKISALFGEEFPFFDNKVFEREAPEGYLFPDTYFVPVTATASSTISLMRENFVRKIFDLMPEVEESGHSLEDIIILASLIEGEADNQVDRVMVSDVLWKRLKIGMPLQVDVELKTYEFPGLPEKPINNPGILSIEAALHPTTTPYMYYLTGHDGKMYYGKTFEEHQANIAKYLSN